jgi:hypothetical protein
MLIDIDEVAVGAAHVNDLRREFRERAVMLFSLSQRLLSPLALGDI